MTENAPASVTPRRLYGLEDDEVLHTDIEDAIHTIVDRFWPDESGEFVVCEYTVHPPQHHMASAPDIVDHITELAAESGEVSEGWCEDAVDASHDATVLAAAEALRDAIANTIGYGMADRVIAKHPVTWRVDADGIEWSIGDPQLTGPDQEASRG